MFASKAEVSVEAAGRCRQRQEQEQEQAQAHTRRKGALQDLVDIHGCGASVCTAVGVTGE